MFISLILLLVITYIISTKWKFFVLWWKIGGPYPIPYTIPISLLKVEKILYAVKQWLNPDGKHWYGFGWIGPYPVVYIAEPDLVQIILTTEQCINKSFFYCAFTDSFGHGLISSNNPEWSRSRKLINPAFTRQTLLSFIPIFNKKVDTLNQILDNHVDSEPIELLPVISKCTFEIAHQTTMGKELSVQTTKHCEQWESTENLMRIVMERVFHFWLLVKPVFIFSHLYKSFKKDKGIYDSWIQKLIHEKVTKENQDGINSKENESQKLNNTSNNNNNDDDGDFDIKKSKNIFIDQAYDLVKRNEFTWDEFESQSKHIVGAAYETISTAVHNVLMMLAMHPEIQEKVFEEIHSLYPNKEFEVSFEEIQEMTYLNMVINEVLRVVPAAPLVGREASEDFEMKKGLWVPKGTNIMIDIFNIHRNPAHWGPDSDKFNPERFSPENIKYIHPYAFIPFLKGPRNCIGFRYAEISLKVILSKIIRNFRFTTDFKYEDLLFVPAVTIKFVQTPKIKIHRREK